MKKIVRELDRLWRLAILVRAFFICERCGKKKMSGELEAHHIYSRAMKGVRWLIENGSCLCRECHRWVTVNPKEAREWYREKKGEEWFEEISKRKREICRRTDEELKELRDDLRKVTQ